MMNVDRRILLVASLAFTAALGGCDDDDPAGPDDDGDLTTFEVTVENVATAFALLGAGVFDTPVGAAAPGALMPGDSFVVELEAGRGDRLHLATMFVQSNDLFIGTDEDGIELFEDGGEPVEGPVTDQIGIWDAGTEVNQELGAGPDQPLNGGTDTGDPDADPNVRAATEDEFDNLPAVEDVVDVRLEDLGEGRIRLVIENVSEVGTLVSSAGESAVFLSPGVFAVSQEEGVLFTLDEPAPNDGLEALAEDGDPAALGAALDPQVGLTHLLSPGVVVAHSQDGVVFEAGAEASSDLEALAEDGDALPLQLGIGDVPGAEANVIFNETDDGDAGPAGPGQSYTVRIEVPEGARLSLATMLVQSNDLFFAPAPEGIALFDATGAPLSGDVTAEIALWDAGTEVDQPLGIGPDQAPRQDGADTGEDEGGVVTDVSDEAGLPDVASVIRVTITPVGS